jgi:hypothetical protein
VRSFIQIVLDVDDIAEQTIYMLNTIYLLYQKDLSETFSDNKVRLAISSMFLFLYT